MCVCSQSLSVQFSRSVVSDSLRPHESQHARLPCPSPTPGDYSNSCPLSLWCHSAISSSVISFYSCPQPLPASESFPMSQLFTSGGRSIGVSASASVLPMSIQDLFPLRLACLISLLSKGLSGVFSSTTVEGINSLAFCLLYLCLVAKSCLTLQLHGLKSTKLPCPWGFSREEYWSG